MTRTQTFAVAVGLIGLSVVMRLVPHAWNVAPIAASALFAGCYLGRRYALIVPVSALVISDFLLGGYTAPVMVSVYVSFIAIGQLGAMLSHRRTVETVVAGSLLGSVVFFFVTNAAVWRFTGMYAHTLDGLIQSYWYALPFFRNTLVGDLLYTGALFGAYEVYHLAQRQLVSRRLRNTSPITL